MIEIGLILSFVMGMATAFIYEWIKRDIEQDRKRSHYAQFKKVKVNFVKSRGDDENPV